MKRCTYQHLKHGLLNEMLKLFNVYSEHGMIISRKSRFFSPFSTDHLVVLPRLGRFATKESFQGRGSSKVTPRTVRPQRPGFSDRKHPVIVLDVSLDSVKKNIEKWNQNMFCFQRCGILWYRNKDLMFFRSLHSLHCTMLRLRPRSRGRSINAFEAEKRRETRRDIATSPRHIATSRTTFRTKSEVRKFRRSNLKISIRNSHILTYFDVVCFEGCMNVSGVLLSWSLQL